MFAYEKMEKKNPKQLKEKFIGKNNASLSLFPPASNPMK